jgi:hypothetical protein
LAIRRWSQHLLALTPLLVIPKDPHSSLLLLLLVLLVLVLLLLLLLLMVISTHAELLWLLELRSMQ